MNEQYEAYRCLVEKALARAVSGENTKGKIPMLLTKAMEYSLLAGGKRLRPVLLLAAYALRETDVAQAIPYAVGLEMIHTYSLIHDDLPAMDDDDLRRGRPTNHKVFGEAMAILAGDGLLNMAYETMLAQAVRLGTREAVTAVEAIARRAGVSGMVAGQVLDVTSEDLVPDMDLVANIHRLKTADLITAPMEGGLLLAGAGKAEVDAGIAYGQHLGLAFQIIDDLLDLTGEEKLLGKQVGTDEKNGKLTWPGCVGLEKSRQDAREHVDLAVKALEMFEQKGNFLTALAQSTLNRVQ